VVSERHVDAGDVVQVGAELYTVVDPRRLRLEASVPANEIERLKIGMPVEFTVTGAGQRVTGVTIPPGDRGEIADVGMQTLAVD